MTDKKNEIMPAIAAAMGQVQKIGKEGRNKHDGYNFASIDDFLALVNPICAANGLIVSMQESAIEDFTRKGKYGENAWLRMTWEITVWHTSGQSLPPVMRTVEVLRNGAQAYGSAQSYALKQFLRSLFLIPTGDKDDADLQPTDAGTVTTDNTEKSPTEADHKDTVKRIRAAIQKAATHDALTALWSHPATKEALKKLPDDLYEELESDHASAEKALKIDAQHDDAVKDSQNGDLDGDNIPYS